MKLIRRFLVLLTLGVVLASCGGSPAASITPTTAPEAPTTVAEASTPTIEPTTVQPTTETTAAPADSTPTASEQTETGGATQSDKAIIAELQTAVDTWAEAYAETDVEKLRSVIDPKAMALRRTQGDLFKYRTESMGASNRSYSGTVVGITRLDLGYVRADVDIGGGRSPFTFKQVNGTWMMSEPKRAELGKKQKQETEYFVFEYYTWDEQILPDIIQIMEDARELDFSKIGREPEEKPIVRLIPTTETGNSKGQALAYFMKPGGALGTTGVMFINSPNSYGSGSYDPAEGWKPALLTTVAHEYVHLLVNCCVPGGVGMNDWMSEGIAEYISNGGVARVGAIAYAVQTDAIIPIQTTSTERYDKQDMEHFTLLDQDVSLGYGFASSLVDYIVRTHGGLDGFWKLVEDYDETQNFDKSLQNIFGITYQQFDEGWRADLKKQFGG